MRHALHTHGLDVLGAVAFHGDATPSWDKGTFWPAGSTVMYWSDYWRATRDVPAAGWLSSGDVPGTSDAWVKVPASSVMGHGGHHGGGGRGFRGGRGLNWAYLPDDDDDGVTIVQNFINTDGTDVFGADDEDRYNAAVAYVKKAIAAVENEPAWYNVIDKYAAGIKTQVPRDDLARIEARHDAATDLKERAAIARDAELLADRTEENLPGAPSGWKRTNLATGEVPTQTSNFTYSDEVKKEAQLRLDEAKAAADKATSWMKWAAIGAGVLAVGGGLLFVKSYSGALGKSHGDATGQFLRRLGRRE